MICQVIEHDQIVILAKHTFRLYPTFSGEAAHSRVARVVHATKSSGDEHMKRLLLAAVATAALSLPAMAQTQPNATPQSGQQQMSPHPRMGQQRPASNQRSQNRSGRNQQQAQNTVKPSQLRRQKIGRIQQVLNKQGFDAGHVDGKWGSSTHRALKEFQRSQHMQASGKLNQQTLQALRVNVTAHGKAAQSAGASTTGQGSGDLQPQRHNSKSRLNQNMQPTKSHSGQQQ